ncbi:MAG: hypothetical protein C4308_08255 [Chitinophagaceae bacterium]
MKSIITFLAIALTVIACEKSPMDSQVAGVNEQSPKEGSIVGTWKLTEYYQDISTGTGQWVPANFNEYMIFGEDGSFSTTPTSPIYSRGYTRWTTKPNLVAFAPGTEKGGYDYYQYAISGNQLIFYPRCREMCMCKYVHL